MAISLGTATLPGAADLGTARLPGTVDLGTVRVDGLQAVAPDALAGVASVEIAAAGAVALAQTAQGAGQVELIAAGSAVLDQPLSAVISVEIAAAGALLDASALAGAAAIEIEAAGAAGLDQALAGSASVEIAASGTILTAGALAGVASVEISAAGAAGLAQTAAGAAGLEIGAAGSVALDQVLSAAAEIEIGASGAAALGQGLSGAGELEIGAAGSAGLAQSTAGAAEVEIAAAGAATVGGGASLPLDSVAVYGSWSAARRLATAYTGSLIRVRRSSDNAEQDIGYNGSDELDVSALAAFVGANSAYIVTLYDQIGTANLTQATAARQPRIVNAGTTDTVGGKPAMFFDGVDDHLNHEVGHDIFAAGASTFIAAHSLAAATNRAVMSEARTATASVNYLAMIEAGGTASSFIRLNSSSVVFNGADLATDAFDGTPHCLSVTWDGTNLNGFLDGVAGSSAAPSGTTPHAPDRLTLGGHSDGTSVYNPAFGPISEAVVARTELSGADRGAIETDIISYYGI